MRKLIPALIIVFSISAAASAQGTDAKAKAEEILKKARAAIGDESKLNTLQSLSFSGTTRRSFGEQQMESETEYEMIFPDKFKRTDNGQFGSMTIALNRDQVWQDFVAAVGMGPGVVMRGGGMMRVGGGGNPDDPAVQERMRNIQRAEFARLLIGMLFFSPSSFPVEFSYLGEAKSPDGTADTILARGPDDFKLALYFDQQTHQLLMMSYKGRQFMQRGRGPGGGPGGQAGPGRAGGQGEQRPQVTPEEREKFRKEMEERLAKLPEIEFRWVFSDYKNVGGLNLPHRLTKSEAGKPNEEFEISKYKINPKISPDKFVKNEKEKAQ